MTTAGLLAASPRDGDAALGALDDGEFGRLTFPNGRTGAPVIDGDCVIIHIITSHWGPQGPARDRFYAFDKRHRRARLDRRRRATRPRTAPFAIPVLE